MIKKPLFAVTLLIVSVSLFGQRKGIKDGRSFDFGLYLGASNYMGELTDGIMPHMPSTNLAGGLIARYNFGPYLTFRGTALYGTIEGDDKNYSSDLAKQRRNLNFTSGIFEFATVAEWNILGFEATRTSYAWSPYLYGGISVFRFNPKTKFVFNSSIHDASLRNQDGDWIELQPLGTEGQETTRYNDKRRYSLTQFSIPVGAGFKWQFADAWTLGIDFGIRKTFTDYIDDISTVYVEDEYVGGANGPMAVALKDRSLEIGQTKYENGETRGNNSNKDVYMFGGITITYRILGGRQPCFNF